MILLPTSLKWMLLPLEHKLLRHGRVQGLCTKKNKLFTWWCALRCTGADSPREAAPPINISHSSPLSLAQILAGDNERADRCSRSKQRRWGRELTDHGLTSRYRPQSAARQSRAACKPLSLAVKRSCADVLMLVQIKKRLFSLLHRRLKMQYAHTLVMRGSKEQNQLYVILHFSSSLNLTLGGANTSPAQPIISVSFS